MRSVKRLKDFRADLAVLDLGLENRAGNGFSREEFERTRDEFYAFQGWSLETGAPTAETLARLGLSDVQIGTGV